MGNRSYIEFDTPEDTSPTTCSYGGSICDDEDDVFFSFDGPPGLLDRVMEGSQSAMNELMGRIYMGCDGAGQDLMDFHWDRGFNGPTRIQHLKATQSIDEATRIVFAERAGHEMEKATTQSVANKTPRRI